MQKHILHSHHTPIGRMLTVVVGLFISFGFLAGCKTLDGLGLDNLGLNTLFAAKPIPISLDEAPIEAKALASAVLMRLHGESEAQVEQQISVANSSVLPALKPGQLAGWRLHGLAISEVTRSEELTGSSRIFGSIFLRDNINRGMVVAFGGTVADAVDGYKLTEGYWSRVAPEDPRTEMYILPMQAASRIVETTPSFTGLYRAVKAGAIPMSGPKAVEVAENEYSIIVFLMDEVLPGDRFAVNISDVQESHVGFGGVTQYHDFKDGWAAAIVNGRFSLTAETSFWVKAVYTKKRRSSRVVGLYNTQPQPSN